MLERASRGRWVRLLKRGRGIASSWLVSCNSWCRHRWRIDRSAPRGMYRGKVTRSSVGEARLRSFPLQLARGGYQSCGGGGGLESARLIGCLRQCHENLLSRALSQSTIKPGPRPKPRQFVANPKAPFSGRAIPLARLFAVRWDTTVGDYSYDLFARAEWSLSRQTSLILSKLILPLTQTFSRHIRNCPY